MPGPTSVGEYLAGLPDDRRATLEELHRTIADAAPEATEQISYNMPAFRSHGRFLVSYSAFKKHYSLFPATEAVTGALGDEVKPYLAGKGTIRFAWDRPLPKEMVQKIVRIRFAENAAETPRRRS